MPLKVVREIKAPLEEVWEQLIDVRRWPVWGPSIAAVDLDELAGHRIALDTRGRVLTPLGLALPFKVTDFEPQAFWRWHVCGVPATGHRVRSLAKKRTELVFEVPYLALPYRRVCVLAAERIAICCEAD